MEKDENLGQPKVGEDISPNLSEQEKEKKVPQYRIEDERRQKEFSQKSAPHMELLLDPTATHQQKMESIAALQLSVLPTLFEELNKTYPSLERSVVASRTNSALNAVSKSIQEKKASELEDSFDAHSPKFQMVLGWFMQLFKESMVENDVDGATVDNVFTSMAGRLEGWEDNINKRMKGVTQKALASVDNPLMEQIKDQIPSRDYSNGESIE